MRHNKSSIYKKCTKADLDEYDDFKMCMNCGAVENKGTFNLKKWLNEDWRNYE